MLSPETEDRLACGHISHLVRRVDAITEPVLEVWVRSGEGLCEI